MDTPDQETRPILASELEQFFDPAGLVHYQLALTRYHLAVTRNELAATQQQLLTVAAQPPLDAGLFVPDTSVPAASNGDN